MTRLPLILLGGFQVRLGEGEPLGLPTKKAQALLAYLALPPGQAHPGDKLAVLLGARALTRAPERASAKAWPASGKPCLPRPSRPWWRRGKP